MKTDKKIEVLSTALAVEIKVLLASYYSGEKIVEVLKLFYKETKKIICACFINRLIQIYQNKNFAQSFYTSIKLYCLCKQM